MISSSWYYDFYLYIFIYLIFPYNTIILLCNNIILIERVTFGLGRKQCAYQACSPTHHKQYYLYYSCCHKSEHALQNYLHLDFIWQVGNRINQKLTYCHRGIYKVYSIISNIFLTETTAREVMMVTLQSVVTPSVHLSPTPLTTTDKMQNNELLSALTN